MDGLDSLTPPTDNLYKFMAIFGLILIILGVGTSWYQNAELQKYGLANKIAGAKYISALLDVRNAEAKLTQAKETEKPELDKELAEAKTRFDNAKDDSVATQASTDFAVDDQKTQSPLLDDLSFAGFWISLFGFIGWYLKVQRYEDLVVRSEAIKHNADWDKLLFWEQLFGKRSGKPILFVFSVIVLVFACSYFRIIPRICHFVAPASTTSKSSPSTTNNR